MRFVGWQQRLLAVLIGACCCAPVAAGTIRDDVPDSAYTALANQPAYASVGQFLYTNGGQQFIASGTLISSRWVLTAAHVTSGSTNMTFTINGTTYTAATNFAYPTWTGDLSAGNDIGLVELSTPITGITPAVRYTGSSEVGQIGTSVGYGNTGTGLTGYVNGTYGTKRAGNNVIDALGTTFGYNKNIILSDFDNPQGTKSVLGSSTALPLEYSIAPGDSGGGTFITVGGAQYLAGVHSFGGALNKPAGDGVADSSYSDYFGSTRVGQFTDWVDDNTAIQWTGGASGAFSTDANWVGGIAPGVNDIAGFSNGATATINFSSAMTNQRLRVRSGNLTLNLNGFTYSQTFDRSVIVGNVSGDNATLTVTGGTLSGLDGIIAEQSGSVGNVTVTGTGALWTTTGNLYVGGSATTISAGTSGGAGTLTTTSGGAIHVGGALEILTSGSSVTLSGATSQAGSLTFTHGTLGGASDLSIISASPASTWTGGTMNGSGRTLIGAGVPLTINAATTKTLDTRTLDDSGTITFSGSGSNILTLQNSANLSIESGGAFNWSSGTLSLNSGSTINTFAGGTFNDQGNLSLGVGSGTASIFNNGGTFLKSAGTGTATIAIPFNNTGNVTVSSGTLTFSGAVSQFSGSTLSGGSWTVDASSTLNIDTGNILTNAGQVTLDGTGSTFSQINSLNNNQGSFTVQNGRNFTTAGTLTDSGSLLANGTSTLTVSGLLTLAGGTVGGSGTVLANSGVNFSGTNTKSGSGAVTISGAQNPSVGATFNVTGGTLNLNSDAGATAANLNLSLSGSGTIANFGSAQHLATLSLGAGTTANFNGTSGNSGSGSFTSGSAPTDPQTVQSATSTGSTLSSFSAISTSGGSSGDTSLNSPSNSISTSSTPITPIDLATGLTNDSLSTPAQSGLSSLASSDPIDNSATGAIDLSTQAAISPLAGYTLGPLSPLTLAISPPVAFDGSVVTPVPEPSALCLAVMALLSGLAIARRQLRRALR